MDGAKLNSLIYYSALALALYFFVCLLVFVLQAIRFALLLVFHAKSSSATNPARVGSHIINVTATELCSSLRSR